MIAILTLCIAVFALLLLIASLRLRSAEAFALDLAQREDLLQNELFALGERNLKLTVESIELNDSQDRLHVELEARRTSVNNLYTTLQAARAEVAQLKAQLPKPKRAYRRKAAP